MRAGIVIALIALAGCAQTKMAAATPVQPPAGLRASDGDYASAKAAIARADYGAALDYLRAAGEVDPKDARVPNALGVVYDLMGRFDLSARAYAQAQALDPNLASIAHNIAYSQQLQASAKAAPAPAPAVAERSAPGNLDAPRLVAVAGNTLRLELPRPAAPAPVAVAPLPVLATAPPPPIPTPPVSTAPIPSPGGAAPPRAFGLTGHPLLVSNASGRAGADAEVRGALAARGWTAKIDVASKPTATTRIVYPPVFENVAQALARTLPGPAQLTACQDGCTGLRLLLGADVSRWKLGGAATTRKS